MTPCGISSNFSPLLLQCCSWLWQVRTSEVAKPSTCSPNYLFHQGRTPSVVTCIRFTTGPSTALLWGKDKIIQWELYARYSQKQPFSLPVKSMRVAGSFCLKGKQLLQPLNWNFLSEPEAYSSEKSPNLREDASSGINVLNKCPREC